MIRSTMLVLSFIGLATGTASAGAALVSPPIRASGSNTISCAVVNIGTKPLENVTMEIFTSEGLSSGIVNTCTLLQPGLACSALGAAGLDDYRYCKVTGGSKKSLRASLCNEATGACVPLQ